MCNLYYRFTWDAGTTFKMNVSFSHCRQVWGGLVSFWGSLGQNPSFCSSLKRNQYKLVSGMLKGFERQTLKRKNDFHPPCVRVQGCFSLLGVRKKSNINKVNNINNNSNNNNNNTKNNNDDDNNHNNNNSSNNNKSYISCSFLIILSIPENPAHLRDLESTKKW